jgi:hypothetical protein
MNTCLCCGRVVESAALCDLCEERIEAWEAAESGEYACAIDDGKYQEVIL